MPYLVDMKVAMLARRLNAPAATPAPKGIKVDRVEDLVRVNGADVEGANGSNLEFGFGQGGLSRARFRTHGGAIWLASCEVWLVKQGELLPCKFGAVFEDEAQKIIKWWQSPAMTAEDGGPMRLKFEAPSAEGASWVRLGMIGPWSESRKSTASYRYTSCQLEPFHHVVDQQEQS